jgi:Ferritin-like domain
MMVLRTAASNRCSGRVSQSLLRGRVSPGLLIFGSGRARSVAARPRTPFWYFSYLNFSPPTDTSTQHSVCQTTEPLASLDTSALVAEKTGGFSCDRHRRIGSPLTSTLARPNSSAWLPNIHVRRASTERGVSRSGLRQGRQGAARLASEAAGHSIPRRSNWREQLDARPRVDVARVPKIGADVHQQLENELKDEEDAVRQYNSAKSICAEALDNGDLFQSLLKDEEGHADFLEAQLYSIEEMGIATYLAQQLQGEK